MIHRGPNKRYTHGGRNAVGKIMHLDGDMTLVMIQRQNRIKLAVNRPIKD